ncbi:MAG: ATP-binding cassette domain-containing protein [Bacillota bacterium]
MPAIIAQEVTKEYRIPQRGHQLGSYLRTLFTPSYHTIRALNAVSFTIEPGETVGYIGLNGAGKSTTVKLLTGILAPTSGRVEVAGVDPHRERVTNARRIGVVFGQRSQLLWDLPVRETFQLLRHVYRVPPQCYQANTRRFFELLGLDAIWDQPVRLLSLGQKMRCELAAAFLHDPSVVYLDEPTIGLDVLAKATIREFLKQISVRTQVTVFLTTHDLRDIEEVCRRVILIHQGSVVYDGSPQKLVQEYGQKARLEVEVVGDVVPTAPPGARLAGRNGNRWVFTFDRQQVRVPELLAALGQTLAIRDLTVTELDLEGVVRRIYGGEAL